MGRMSTSKIDYTDRDYEAYREMMINALQEKMPEYTDISPTDAGIVILECLANGLDICSMYTDVIANDVLLPTTQDRRMACILARNLGYTPYSQTSSIIEQVFVLNEVKSVETYIPKGTVVTTEVAENTDEEPIMFETLENLIIPPGKLGDEKDEYGNYLYTVKVAQGESVIEDLLGSSTGASFQTFVLNFKEVLTDTIELYVDEGDGGKLWKQVESFLDEDIDETSKVYTVNVDDFDNCYIEFGNNIRGKIPTVFENGIYASYRVGGGEIGNVRENTIVVYDGDNADIDHTFNPNKPLVYGHEKESIDEIKENAPASFRTRDRAVTLQDYSDLLRVNNKGNMYAILNSKGVRDYEDLTNIKLYYQLRSEYTMTEELKQEILDFFSERIIIGTTVELLEYIPHNIDIEANLIVDRDYYQEDVKLRVESYIRDTFFGYGSLTFDDEFIRTDLENEVNQYIDGVRSFRINTPSQDIVSPNSGEILVLGTITINMTGGKVNE